MSWMKIDPKRSETWPPNNLVVETKIDDEQGVRNETTLKRRENLFFFPDDSMYVYYCPTHWRPVPPNPLSPRPANNEIRDMNLPQQSIGREAAIRLANSNWWEGKTPKEIAMFQMKTQELCLPFDVFHKAMEDALGRPVWTHEFGLNPDGLWLELIGEADAPSMEDIINLIPEEKRVLLLTD